VICAFQIGFAKAPDCARLTAEQRRPNNSADDLGRGHV
jgi:hypothetical protein